MTHDERQQLIDQYAAGYADITRALEGLTDDQLSARPIPGKWSAREIVHHLADSETHSALRLRTLLVEPRPVIAAYDQEAYAVRLRYNERPIEPALQAFEAARATTMQLLRAMSDDDWRREGTHSASGRYTAETWLAIYAVHARDHAAQIVRLREALTPAAR
jgi:DinB superfamily